MMIIDNYGSFIYSIIHDDDGGFKGVCICFDYELNNWVYFSDFILYEEIVLICL